MLYHIVLSLCDEEDAIASVPRACSSSEANGMNRLDSKEELDYDSGILRLQRTAPGPAPDPSPKSLTGLVREVEYDTLFLSILDLFMPDGHFRLRAAVDHMNLICAQPQRAAGRIHGHVSAADRGHLLTSANGRIISGNR